MTEHTPIRIAVIDLGSNTARLIVLLAIPGYSYRLVDQIREVVRLRQGMDARGLSAEAEMRAFSTLRLFTRFCESNAVNAILPVATSAVRDAANGPEFVERVADEIGIRLRVLSGEKEAYYGVIGVLNEVPFERGFVLDIGGGSAQVSEVKDGRFFRGDALPLGALALTEKFIRDDPPDPKETQRLEEEINRQLDTFSWLKPRKESLLVGMGGSIRSLARIEAARQEYPLTTLHGFPLECSSVEASITQFCQMSLKDRKRIPGLDSDRADIILAGAMVLLGVMTRLDLRQITISVSGLREGVFIEKFWQHLSYPVIPDVRRFSVLNMARTYNYQKNHTNHVRFLSLRIFEQLEPLHGYGPMERELLDAASMLHDLGLAISYESHHKHSQTLIEHNGLAGFSPREIAIISLLTRYHRKGTPRTSGYEMLLEKQDKTIITRLAAILRLSEYLERSRNAKVDDVAVSWNQDTLRLTLIADEYPAVEIWQTERNALALMEKAFGKQVILESLAPPTIKWLD